MPPSETTHFWSIVTFLLRYSFGLAVAFLAYFYAELASDHIMDATTLAVLALAVILFACSKKTLFYTFYFNYLAWWICVGNINFLITRLLWAGWDGDLVRENRIYSVFLVIFALVGYVLTRRVREPRPGPIVFDNVNYPLFLLITGAVIAIYTAVYLPLVGYGGVYFGSITDENRFTLDLPSFLNRMVFGFHIMMLFLVHRVLQGRLRLRTLLLFVIFSFFVLTVGGARWSFFQVVTTAFFFLALTDRLSVFRRYKVPTIILGIIFVAYQPLLSILRSGGSAADSMQTFAGLTSFFASWAGEFRDGAASLTRFGTNTIHEISRNYLSTLIVPIIPRQITGLVGIDRDLVMRMSGAFFMQDEYGIPFGSIRIGGVMEAFYWGGMVGVGVLALLNGLAAYMIDRFAYAPGNSLLRACTLAFSATSLLYFVASQSSALLAPIFAFLSVLYGTKLIQFAMGLPNSATMPEVPIAATEATT